MRILLQFPEGLKEQALKYAKKEEEKGNEVFISSSPNFGACDLAISEAEKIGADKIIHFGHAEFNKVNFNVEYVEYEIDAPYDMLPNSLKLLKNFKKIGIVTTIQHVHQLPSIKEFYEKNGKEVLIGKPYGFAKKEGQILGCDVGSAARINKEVDAFVYFGGGIFHPLGAVLATTKPFLAIDPFISKMEFIDSQRDIYKRKSIAKIYSAINAKKIGILVSTKNGQYNMATAKVLKGMITRAGLEAYILVSNTFDFESLSNIRNIDAFVNTACPRIAIDDTERISKPLMSPQELAELLEIIKNVKS
ncbi:MAG: diphthamide biosynthesis enzyme Dph2 [Candidatus Micrarchaeia archaeon]